MNGLYERTKLIIGEKGIDILKKSSVAIFGVGGVGGYVTEMLSRAGIGNLTLVDGDVFCESNLNRQLYANVNTLNKNKAEVAAEHIRSVNNECNVCAIPLFYTKETEFDFNKYDYVVDAIDSVNDKISIIVNSQKANTSVISSMGAGNKLTTDFKVMDIYETSICPLARVMRRKLRDAGVVSLKTVFSSDMPQKPADGSIVGSISFAPAAAGIKIAGEVINDLLKKAEE